MGLLRIERPAQIANMINDYLGDLAAPLWTEFTESAAGIERILAASAERE